MDDLISRQVAIDAFEDTTFTKNEILRRLSEVPSAQPERKRGKWIFKNNLKQFFCSECGLPSLTYDDVYIYSMDLPNFCEDCGADMRGEDNV